MLWLRPKISEIVVQEISLPTVVTNLLPRSPCPLPKPPWSHVAHHGAPWSALSKNLPLLHIPSRPPPQVLYPDAPHSFLVGRSMLPMSVPPVKSCLGTPSESTAPLADTVSAPASSPAWPLSPTPLGTPHAFHMGHLLSPSWGLSLIALSPLLMESRHIPPLVLPVWEPIFPLTAYTCRSLPSI